VTKSGKRKALGQHFLHDRQVLRRIVDVIDPQPEETILEIGAGKGMLTFALAKRKARIIAVEKDTSLVPHLKKKDFPNVIIIEKDILKVRFKDLLSPKQAKVVGNLPYSLSSPILFKVLAEKDSVSFCVFLLQKEFAQRLCARPGSKKYAPLSIIFQNFFSTKFHFRVSAASFSPPPEVESGLVSLKKRPLPLFLIARQELFLRFLKGAFRHRRKKLSNNLKKLRLPEPFIENILKTCGIDDSLRPEQISLSQFVHLFNCFPDETLRDHLA
jgi:16S rRNA (adenine1518-N6/adenine1519-N6)-dimethyltransferase